MCGIDEVGVGAIAGPLVAAAAIINPERPWTSELRDSKELTPEKRNELYTLITQEGLCFAVVPCDADAIDRQGIARARLFAMETAFIRVEGQLPPGTKLGAVVDGRFLKKHAKRFGGDVSVFTDKADQRSMSVAAASILAKVWRDAFMTALGRVIPHFGFEEHMGYPTPRHIEALNKYGPTMFHRKSFKPVSGIILTKEEG